MSNYELISYSDVYLDSYEIYFIKTHKENEKRRIFFGFVCLIIILICLIVVLFALIVFIIFMSHHSILVQSSSTTTSTNGPLKIIKDATSSSFLSTVFGSTQIPTFASTKESKQTSDLSISEIYTKVADKSTKALLTTKRMEKISPTSPQIKCGLSDIKTSLNDRIVRGQKAIANSWPWMVSIRRYTRNGATHVCGGSLIDQQFVLTASHCVINYSKDKLVVLAGTNSFSGLALKPSNFYNVSNIFSHELYDRKNLRNDIAILKLSRPVASTAKLAPICLPESSDSNIMYDQKGIVAGWYKN